MLSVSLALNQVAKRVTRIAPVMSRTISSPLPRTHVLKSLSDVMPSTVRELTVDTCRKP